MYVQTSYFKKCIQPEHTYSELLNKCIRAERTLLTYELAYKLTGSELPDNTEKGSSTQENPAAPAWPPPP